MENNLELNKFLEKLSKLFIVDNVESNVQNNVYYTILTEWHNKEKQHYIYFTQLIHCDDICRILDEINNCKELSVDKIMHFNSLINLATIKIYAQEPFVSTFVSVSVQRKSQWAKLIPSIIARGEIPLTFGDALRVLSFYDYKKDFSKTYQQCLEHIINLESTVKLLQDIDEMCSELGEVIKPINKYAIPEELRINIDKQKRELDTIIAKL